MASLIHTALVELLEAHPDALAYLLELAGSPPSGPLLPITGTRTKVMTLERRVDRAFLVGDSKPPEAFILAEVQLDPDDDKFYAWALYVELARTRYRCEGALVVLTTSEGVRRWIARTIVPRTGKYGTLRGLEPTVIALDQIDPSLLLRPDRTYLAMLAVAGHAALPDAEEIAEAAVDLTFGNLAKPFAAEQLDVILGMVNEALRASLESRIMEHHEYRSELFRGIYEKGEAEGETRGEARGEARGILAVLGARGIPVSDAIRERILGCSDIALLDTWIRRAAVVSTAAAVVRAKAPAAKRPARRARNA
jgi:hypothetical protein